MRKPNKITTIEDYEGKWYFLDSEDYQFFIIDTDKLFLEISLRDELVNGMYLHYPDFDNLMDCPEDREYFVKQCESFFEHYCDSPESFLEIVNQVNAGMYRGSSEMKVLLRNKARKSIEN